MTIWVFGDSFAQMTDKNDDQWMQRISKNINTDVISKGLNGSSLEYSFDQFNKERSNIKQNDVLIILLTGFDRYWFFRDYPNNNSLKSPTNNNKETKSIENFVTYLNKDLMVNDTYFLNFPDIKEIYLLNFLYNVRHITENLGLHTIFISNFLDTSLYLNKIKDQFPQFNFVNGLLLDVSTHEYEYEYYYKFYKNLPYGYNDIRTNHLIKSNHIILADKIIDNIKNKNPIDLTTGFVKHVINENAVKDNTFIKEELF